MKSIIDCKKMMFATTVLGNFIAIFETATVNIALFQISKTFSVSLNSVQLVPAVYVLIFTLLLPFFGKLSDVFSRKNLYIAGFVCFSIGSLLNIFAFSLTSLIISRSIQAIGGAIIMSNATAIITLLYNGEERGKMLGVTAAVIAMAGLIGPVLSGFIIHYFSWHFIFLPSFIVGIIGIIFSYKFIPKFSQISQQKFDIKGYILFLAMMLPLFSILTFYQNAPFIKSNIVPFLSISFISAIIFFKYEKKIEFPVIELNIFKNKVFLFSCISLFFSFMTIMANQIIYPFLTQSGLGYSSILTGWLFFIYAASLMIVGPFAGAYAGKNGSFKITILGCVIYIIGFVMLYFVDKNVQLYYLILAQIVLGIGNALFQSPTNTDAMNNVKRSQVGSASGLLSLSRNTGILFGLVCSVLIFEKTSYSGVIHNTVQNSNLFLGFKSVISLCIFLSLLCLLATFFAHKKRLVDTFRQ